MSRMRSPFLYLFLLALVFAAPALRAQREYLTPDELEHVEKTWPGTKRTNTGIRYLVQKPGDGESPKSGEVASVLYIGRLLDGTEFDRQLDPARALSFRVDRDGIIEGWNQIVKLMKLHEKRLVIIPGALAYGSRGRPPSIPRDAVLVFEMELVGIKHN